MPDNKQNSHKSLVSDDTVFGSLSPLTQLEGEDMMEVVPQDSRPNLVEGESVSSYSWRVYMLNIVRTM